MWHTLYQMRCRGAPYIHILCYLKHIIVCKAFAAWTCSISVRNSHLQLLFFFVIHRSVKDLTATAQSKGKLCTSVELFVWLMPCISSHKDTDTHRRVSGQINVWSTLCTAFKQLLTDDTEQLKAFDQSAWLLPVLWGQLVCVRCYGDLKDAVQF